ncbi:MAG: hypothetical protein DME55_08855 [Verrucomicrobia bacterium]|nr:MAG: hypothetical protein DME55_08855 [Verrucomicrobiota bacterium]
MNYNYRAVEKFWRNFYKLRPEQKKSVRRVWQVFKSDPFHPSLGSHEIHELSARAKHTICGCDRSGSASDIPDRWLVGNDTRYREA